VQLEKTSGLNPTSKEFERNYEGRCKGWDKYLNQITDTDLDTPLTDDILANPNHPATQMCLYLYTISGWLFAELNKGSREGDQAKVDTLGPFAKTFGYII